MRRTVIVLLVAVGASTGTAATTAPSADPPRGSHAAWPHRIMVRDPAGRRMPMALVSLGAEVAVRIGDAQGISRVRMLVSGDTLRATTPGDYPVDLAGGVLMVFGAAGESIQVDVGGNPAGTVGRMTARGQQITVRASEGRFILDAR